LSGKGFHNIPDDSIAVVTDTDNPLQGRYTDAQSNILNIIEKTENTIIFEAAVAADTGRTHWFGAILSPDRSIVYWVYQR
jgi:hypothetical protein